MEGQANSGIYYVIRFIQLPNINFDKNVVVPESWLWIGNSEFVLVAYPEQHSEIIRKRVENNETYEEHWKFFKAVVKSNFQTFWNAQNLATRLNFMDIVTPYPEINNNMSNTLGSHIVSERQSTNPTTSNTNNAIPMEVPLVLQRLHNNNQNNSKKSPCKRQLPENILVELRALGKQARVFHPNLQDLSINTSSLNEQQLQPSHQYPSNGISSNIKRDQSQILITKVNVDNQAPPRRNYNNRAVPQEAARKVMSTQRIFRNSTNNHSDLQIKQLVEKQPESCQTLLNQAFSSTQVSGTRNSLHGSSVQGRRTSNVSQTLQKSLNSTNNEEQPQPCSSNQAYNGKYPKQKKTIVKKCVKQNILQKILSNDDFIKKTTDLILKNFSKQIKNLHQPIKKTTKKPSVQQQSRTPEQPPQCSSNQPYAITGRTGSPQNQSCSSGTQKEFISLELASDEE